MFWIYCALLLLCSCGKQSYWAHDTIRSDNLRSGYSKVIYSSRDPIHGIDLEFVSAADQLKGYLNIHSTPLPMHPEHPKLIPVKVEIDGQIISYEAFRLEGGQRVLLPEELLGVLVEALSSDKNVMLSLPGYRSQILAEGFIRHFNRMQHPFFMDNPFHLPF